MANDEPRVGSSTETTPTEFNARLEAMFGRMQTPEFADAVLKMLDEQPLRVPLPKHLRLESDP